MTSSLEYGQDLADAEAAERRRLTSVRWSAALSALVVGLNLAIDLSYAFLDPRIRYR